MIDWRVSLRDAILRYRAKAAAIERTLSRPFPQLGSHGVPFHPSQRGLLRLEEERLRMEQAAADLEAEYQRREKQERERQRSQSAVEQQPSTTHEIQPEGQKAVPPGGAKGPVSSAPALAGVSTVSSREAKKQRDAAILNIWPRRKKGDIDYQEVCRRLDKDKVPVLESWPKNTWMENLDNSTTDERVRKYIHDVIRPRRPLRKRVRMQ